MTERDEQNHRDLLSAVDAINEHLAGGADFCVLPGDNADDGTPEQYALIRSAIDGLVVPLHAIPGDHDRAAGNLDAFYAGLGSPHLPYSVLAGGCRCLFLDAVSHGGGGPDFHLGESQLAWMERELREASSAGQTKAVIVHAYPADFPRDRQRFRQLLTDHQVRVVDMGHTHYNELANDGTTLFATTRSTGQIEEGSVGFSMVTLQAGTVNWRFKPLSSRWPFAMITSPGDHRLQQDGVPERADRATLRVAARAWSGRGIVDCRYRINEGAWHRMMKKSGGAEEWEAPCEAVSERFDLTVAAQDARGDVGSDRITIAERHFLGPARTADGSDADALPAWPDRHLLGTRLGPNRNGRQW